MFGEKPDQSVQLRCNFHGDGHDQTPSARYYPESDSYKCYACDQLYDSVEYYRRANDLTFEDTIKMFLVKIGREDLMSLREEDWKVGFDVGEGESKGVEFNAMFLEGAVINLDAYGDDMKKKLITIKDVWPTLSKEKRKRVVDELVKAKVLTSASEISL